MSEYVAVTVPPPATVTDVPLFHTMQFNIVTVPALEYTAAPLVPEVFFVMVQLVR